MKRKNKIFRKVIIVLAVLALLTGCAGQEPEAEDTRTPTDDNLIVVGVSQEGSESVWRTANTRSVKETLTKENGYFLIFKNARQKQENRSRLDSSEDPLHREVCLPHPKHAMLIWFISGGRRSFRRRR